MSEEFRKLIGRRIKKLRRSRGVSQVQLGGNLGVGQSLISKIESGNLGVSLELAKKLSAVLRVKLDRLAADEER